MSEDRRAFCQYVRERQTGRRERALTSTAVVGQDDSVRSVLRCERDIFNVLNSLDDDGQLGQALHQERCQTKVSQ